MYNCTTLYSFKRRPLERMLNDLYEGRETDLCIYLLRDLHRRANNGASYASLFSVACKMLTARRQIPATLTISGKIESKAALFLFRRHFSRMLVRMRESTRAHTEHAAVETCVPRASFSSIRTYVNGSGTNVLLNRFCINHGCQHTLRGNMPVFVGILRTDRYVMKYITG